MQEAFFGASTMAKSKEINYCFEEDLNENSSNLKMKINRDSNHHRINLDENMLKSAQLNKKAHLELGIEGERRILNFLFLKPLNNDFNF